MNTVDEELKFLRKVENIIDEQITELDRLVHITDKDMEDFHEYFWNSYTEFDEYGYELYDNTNAIRQKIVQKGDYIREKYTLKRMKDSPYFGRVDFVFDGESEALPIYVGISNLSRSAGDIPVIYDWRAPVSSLFYDFDAGRAYYTAPMGQIEGTISHKYQYKISSGRIIYMLESDISIDDDILKAELGKGANASLKAIVTTIQREQNTIIRDTSHRILAVQGCAGSGKTSIALHRIAYLLYHNRNTLKASQILILSPNGLFADYISRILPELGEENICEMSLDIWAYRRLSKFGEAQDKYDRLEEMIDPAGSGKTLATDEAEYKQTAEFVEELDGYLLELESEGIRIRDYRYRGRTYKASYISSLFYEKLWDVPFMERMGRIAEFVIDEEETLRNHDMSAEEKMYIRDSLNAMYVSRDIMQLYNDFLAQTDRRTLDTYITGIDPEEDNSEEIDLDTDKPVYKPAKKGYLRTDVIPYEDVYPILYLKHSLFADRSERPVKHLIIDEMQDYSYLQYRLIEKLFNCAMTILGDKAQTLDEGERDVLEFLPSIFGKEMHSVTLDKSYRSTIEITEYAAGIAGLDTVSSIDRHGEAVTEISYENESARTDALLRILAEETGEMQTVAVLCKNAAKAESVYREVIKACSAGENIPGAENIDSVSDNDAAAGSDGDKMTHTGMEISLLKSDSSTFKPGISIAPFYLSKGLEFDMVIILDDEFEPDALYRQARYVEATRALHVLKILKLDSIK